MSPLAALPLPPIIFLLLLFPQSTFAAPSSIPRPRASAATTWHHPPWSPSPVTPGILAPNDSAQLLAEARAELKLVLAQRDALREALWRYAQPSAAASDAASHPPRAANSSYYQYDTYPHSTPIDRRTPQSLSFRRFFYLYAHEAAKRPVVITNYSSLILKGRRARQRLTLAGLSELCGRQPVMLSRYVPESREWAGLVSSTSSDAMTPATTTTTTTLGEFIQRIRFSSSSHPTPKRNASPSTEPISTQSSSAHVAAAAAANSSSHPFFLFDWSLPRNCPAALDFFHVRSHCVASPQSPTPLRSTTNLELHVEVS